MKDLTIHKAITNTFNGLQKYVTTSSMQGDNVFFYMPATLIRIVGAGFAMIETDDNLEPTPVPLDDYLVDPTVKDDEITGTVAIDFKVLDSDQNVISFMNTKPIPLGSPMYNKAYLIPKVTWKRGRYYGFATKFPHLDQDATIKITEHWTLQYPDLKYPFAYQRELEIPVHPNKATDSYNLKVDDGPRNPNGFVSRVVGQCDSASYPTHIQLIFDPVRTYNFTDLGTDNSYKQFGNQSIIFDNQPHINSLYVFQDAQQPLQLQLMNWQPFTSPEPLVEPEQEQRNTVDMLLAKLNNPDHWRGLLYQADNADWLKARFNLFNLEGKQFIRVYDDHNHEKLELKFPIFNVTK